VLGYATKPIIYRLTIEAECVVFTSVMPAKFGIRRHSVTGQISWRRYKPSVRYITTCVSPTPYERQLGSSLRRFLFLAHPSALLRSEQVGYNNNCTCSRDGEFQAAL
jgi:hypothetical protein